MSLPTKLTANTCSQEPIKPLLESASVKFLFTHELSRDQHLFSTLKLVVRAKVCHSLGTRKRPTTSSLPWLLTCALQFHAEDDGATNRWNVGDSWCYSTRKSRPSSLRSAATDRLLDTRNKGDCVSRAGILETGRLRRSSSWPRIIKILALWLRFATTSGFTFHFEKADTMIWPSWITHSYFAINIFSHT